MTHIHESRVSASLLSTLLSSAKIKHPAGDAFMMSETEDIPDPPAPVAEEAINNDGDTSEKSLSVQESWSELSDSDVAKFPALFGVRQIIKSDPVEARSQLLEVSSGIKYFQCHFN